MNGHDLLAQLSRPGQVLVWIEQLDSYIEVTKVVLRNTLHDLGADRLDTLDINARWDDDRLLVIEDFGPVFAADFMSEPVT